MKALTANRLLDGEVVFWRAGRWVERFADAELFDDDAAAEAAETLARAQITLLVDPYQIEVTADEGAPTPLAFRERLRALGPTNRREHGKQAERGHAIQALIDAHGVARSKGRVALISRR